MRTTQSLLIAAVFAVSSLFGAGAQAADDIKSVVADQVDKAEATDAKEAEPKGWQFGLSLGSTLSFSHNSKVVGSPDGSTFQFGLVMDGLAGYYGVEHEWVNELALKETISKTPTIDPFVKTADSLEFTTTYFYRPPAIPWLGPFARVKFGTAIFPGYDVRDSDLQLAKEGQDPADYETVAAQEKIELTDWFEPVTLKETVGVFATPVTRDEVKLRITLGVGAQEVFTQDGYVLADDDATEGILELQQLQDYQQVGGEFEVAVNGTAHEYLTWSFVANLFQPFYSSEEQGKSGFDLLDVTLDAKVSVKLASWLSLDYVLSAKRIPLILDEWQVQNGLMLTAGFNLI